MDFSFAIWVSIVFSLTQSGKHQESALWGTYDNFLLSISALFAALLRKKTVSTLSKSLYNHFSRTLRLMEGNFCVKNLHLICRFFFTQHELLLPVTNVIAPWR